MALFLKKQESLSLQEFSKNGIKTKVHSVVKNMPFGICIGCNSSVGIDLNNCKLTGRLLYATEEKRPVDFLKTKPMEFICRVSEDGKEASFDIKFNVLSSQHENNFFLIEFCVVELKSDAIGGNGAGTNVGEEEEENKIIILSETIRSISKADNAKKKPTKISATGRKRSFNEAFEEKLDLLTKQQQQFQIDQQKQIQLLQSMISNPIIPSLGTSSSNGVTPSFGDNYIPNVCSPIALDSRDPSFVNTSVDYSQQQKKQKLDNSCDNDTSFEDAFQNLIRSWKNTNQEDRINKIRKITSCLDEETKNCFSQINDQISNQNSPFSPGTSSSSSEGESSCYDDNFGNNNGSFGTSFTLSTSLSQYDDPNNDETFNFLDLLAPQPVFQ